MMRLKIFLWISAAAQSPRLSESGGSPANIAEMDRRFVKQFGGPDNEQILVLPLVLKEKVAALLYADGGATACWMLPLSKCW